MIKSARILGATGVALFSALTLSACNSSTPSPAASSAAPAPASATATTASAPAVAGYQVGEIPPVPLFTVPSIEVFASNSDKAIIQATTTLASTPGITVSPAQCDGNGVVSGSTIFDGNGGGISTSSNGSTVNAGDGSGIINEGPISIIYDGAGGGIYTNTDTNLSITISGDGTGNYTDQTISLTINADGSGNYTNRSTGESIMVNADGSGNYARGNVSIMNNGDGSGQYSDGTITIMNNGDGTATVNGTKVSNAPALAPVAKVGPFPSVASLSPVESCGTVITLEDGLLFDFGSSTIRPEASTTLSNLARALNSAQVPVAHVYGHTDSVSDEAFNLQLSQERADAVSNELRQDGVSAALDAQGFGESRPVAPNENADGSDNPAGRALNRRVEIFIPAF